MALARLSPTVTVVGEVGGVSVEVLGTVTETLITDEAGLLTTATLVPDKLMWNDYGTNPLTYTLSIVNLEPDHAFGGPINISVLIDPTQATFVADSVSSADSTAFENVAYEAPTGTLSLVLPNDIAALTGTASVSFQVEKPAA